MIKKVSPKFDPISKTWFIDGFEAPSLRALKLKMGKGFEFDGYYPNGYHEKTIWPTTNEKAQSKRLPLIFKAKQVTHRQQEQPYEAADLKKKYDPVRRRYFKYDHDAILNLWVKGKSVPAIAKELKLEDHCKRIEEIIMEKRKQGDPRAVRRNKKATRSE